MEWPLVGNAQQLRFTSQTWNQRKAPAPQPVSGVLNLNGICS
jgi:hypothetical protein